MSETHPTFTESQLQSQCAEDKRTVTDLGKGNQHNTLWTHWEETPRPDFFRERERVSRTSLKGAYPVAS